MRQRLRDEFELLLGAYVDAEHREFGGEDWFRLPRYPVPDGWRIGTDIVSVMPVVFRITAAYPTGEPYGFYAPAGINFRGHAPGNPGSGVQPPFDGGWQHFSWSPDGWTPCAECRRGMNLLTWARSLGQRLREGA